MKNKIILFAILFFINMLSAQQKGATPLFTQKSSLTTSSTYAIVVGISDYQDKDIPDLRFADRDAIAFANFLQSPAGGSLDGDHLKLMINQDATGAQISMALDWLIEVSKENDQVIIYFSGHGDVETRRISSPGYLLGWNAPSRVYMSGGTVNVRDLQDIVSTLSVQNKAKVVLITDACHSGKLSGNEINGSQLTGQNLARQFANEVKILSCQPNEYSIEGEQWGGGRGVFSYHLVNSLYGLADDNKDFVVSLKEIGRYLDDKVTTEVAPVNQNPQIIGNPVEILARVDANLLAAMQSGNQSQMSMLSPIETRGIEDEVLSGLDSTVKELYQLFKSAIKDKKLLEPENACAEVYYNRLSAEPKLARLHSTLRRNYASALQDDAQEAMNIWLKADVQQLQCIGKSLKLEPIPRLLARSAELLGKNHYMYNSLQARKLLFEGILAFKNNWYGNQDIGRKCLSLFRQSLELEPQSPLPWYRMSLVYLEDFKHVDSAFICAEKARQLNPNWVLPFVDLGGKIGDKNLELAKKAYTIAEKIDSLHPYVINGWASWYNRLGGSKNTNKAISMFQKYLDEGGVTYPCWYHSYASALLSLERYDLAEIVLKKGLSKDSTEQSLWGQLAYVYNMTGRFELAEPILKRRVAIDSLSYVLNNNLAYLYHETGRLEEAEQLYRKSIASNPNYSLAIHNLIRLLHQLKRFPEADTLANRLSALDSTNYEILTRLAEIYIKSNRSIEAEEIFKQAIRYDKNTTYSLNKLGTYYFNKRRYSEAEEIFKQAIAKDSTDISVWGNLAAVYNMTGRFTLAEPILKKVIALDSTKSINWNNLGYLYSQLNRYDEAIDMYEKAIALNSYDKLPMNNIIGLLRKMKRFPEAETMANRLLALDSTQFESWNTLGLLYIDMQRYTEAESIYKNLIAKDSTNTTTWNNLGYNYLRSKSYMDAEIMLHKAIALDSNSLYGWSNLGRVYTQTHKFDEAGKYLQKALSLNPKNTFAILGRACLFTREGKTGEAIHEVEQAIVNGSDYIELMGEEDLAALHVTPEWKLLIQKHFPQHYKE